MNKNVMLALVGLLVVAGGGYFYFKNRCETDPTGTVCGWLGYSAPAAGSGSNPPAADDTGGADTPPTGSGSDTTDPVAVLAANLATWTKGDAFFTGGRGNADHFSFYYNQHKTPLTTDQFTAAFGADRTGGYADGLMSAAQYAAKIHDIGLVGLPPGLAALSAVSVNVPAWLLHQAWAQSRPGFDARVPLRLLHGDWAGSREMRPMVMR